MSWTRVWGTLVLVGAVGACSLLVDPNHAQCSTTEDCVSRGATFAESVCIEQHCVPRSTNLPDSAGTEDAASEAGFNGPWSCVGKVEWPTIARTTTLTLTIPFTRFLNDAPVAGVSVTACDLVDIDCQSPLNTGVTDETGIATVAVYYGFNGYFMATYPDESLVPSLSRNYPPPTVDLQTEQSRPISHVELLALATQAHQVVDPTRGHLAVQTMDCDRTPTGGIVIRSTRRTHNPTASIFRRNFRRPSRPPAQPGPRRSTVRLGATLT